MLKGSVLIALVLGLISICFSANANLIINGSFEENNISDHSWRWFTSSDVNGWNGSNIEIWDALQGFEAHSGEQHAELNSHPSNGNPFSIFQTFATEIGSVYDVSFAYAARTNRNEAFQFDIFSSRGFLFSDIIDDHQVKIWSIFNLSFEAIAEFTTVQFTSVTPSTRTVGNFLDDISVIERQPPLLASFATTSDPTNVSEPSSLVIILAAGLLIIAFRRKNQIATAKSA